MPASKCNTEVLGRQVPRPQLAAEGLSRDSRGHLLRPFMFNEYFRGRAFWDIPGGISLILAPMAGIRHAHRRACSAIIHMSKALPPCHGCKRKRSRSSRLIRVNDIVQTMIKCGSLSNSRFSAALCRDRARSHDLSETCRLFPAAPATGIDLDRKSKEALRWDSKRDGRSLADRGRMEIPISLVFRDLFSPLLVPGSSHRSRFPFPVGQTCQITCGLLGCASLPVCGRMQERAHTAPAALVPALAQITCGCSVP